MKANELREMSSDELQASLQKEQEALFKLRFRGTTGKLENPMKKRHTRREIARILTIMGQKKTSARVSA